MHLSVQTRSANIKKQHESQSLFEYQFHMAFNTATKKQQFAVKLHWPKNLPRNLQNEPARLKLLASCLKTNFTSANNTWKSQWDLCSAKYKTEAILRKLSYCHGQENCNKPAQTFLVKCLTISANDDTIHVFHAGAWIKNPTWAEISPCGMLMVSGRLA